MPFTDADVPDLAGKTYFVTGANTGLGFETAKVLARQGARVLLGCRNRTKADAALQSLRADLPEADAVVVDIDLGDLESVRSAAEIVSGEARIDGLINNAGIMFPPLQRTRDGFESQLGVNHLGAFALTAHLLPTLERTPNSRIVAVSSNAHKAGRINFDDLNAERSYNKYGRYCQSKLANLLFTYELDRHLRAKGSTTLSVAAHPGAAHTELSRHSNPRLFGLIQRPIARFMNTAAQGAWPLEMAATAPGVQGGQYFGPSGFGEMGGPAEEVDSSARSKDADTARRLWDVSAEMTGVEPAL